LIQPLRGGDGPARCRPNAERATPRASYLLAFAFESTRARVHG